MRRFVSEGADVIVKPNVCIARGPSAATTNPVVATLVDLAWPGEPGTRHGLGFGSPTRGLPDQRCPEGGRERRRLGRDHGPLRSCRRPSRRQDRQGGVPQHTAIGHNVPSPRRTADLLTLGGKNLWGHTDPGGFHDDIGQRVRPGQRRVRL
jgi:hypothetical protein